jgi:hypothetical protein
MIAKVFISHSCKDNEKKPPAGLSKEQADARAKRLKFARALRDRLDAKLGKNTRFKVFLDVRGGLNPGDVWRNGLHNALRTCAAGVVLLTPESLESRWVLKEATILSWRVFVGDLKVLVPIVLGVSRADLKEAGFGALELDAIQQIDVESSSAKDLNLAVKKAVTAIHEKVVGPSAEDKPLTDTEFWIERFAGRLRKIIGDQTTRLGSQYLRDMCAALEISAEDKLRFDDDPFINLASNLLVADDGQVIRFLLKAGEPDKDERVSLKDAVAAMWVDPTPASRLREPGKKVIAIDASKFASVHDYLVRAYCNKVDWTRVVEVNDANDGTDLAVITEVTTELKRLMKTDKPEILKEEVEKYGPIYVLLGPGSTRASVLDSLTASFPPVTFIVAAGTRPEEKLGAWYQRAELLRPKLQPAEREDAGDRFRNRLINFVQGNRQ